MMNNPKLSLPHSKSGWLRMRWTGSPFPSLLIPPDVKSVVGHPADASQHGIQDCLLCLVFKGSLGHHFVIPHHSPCLPAFPFCLGSHLAIKKRQLIELIAKKKAELEAKSKAAQEHAAAPLFLVSCSQAGVGTWGCDVLLLGCLGYVVAPNPSYQFTSMLVRNQRLRNHIDQTFSMHQKMLMTKPLGIL